MKRALLSVSDKTGLIEFATALVRHGYTLISTGGTMRALEERGLPVRSLADVTKHPEILGGRVKTLHPAVFAGILAKDSEEHQRTIAELGYENFDIVVVNLYPFVQASKKPGISDDDLIEEIDIGGPSLLRAACKNHARVTVCSDPSDYADVAAALEAHRGQLSGELRQKLAVRTLFRTASYDAQIASTLAERAGMSLPELKQVAFGYDHAYNLRYGENPHQVAAAFSDPLAKHSLLEAAKLQGKSLSYNNLLDTDAALRMLLDLSRDNKRAACVIVKHNSPCGAAVAPSLSSAYAQALACDAKSAFGGIVALSAEVDLALAERLTELFLEVVVAPAFSDGARQHLQTKKNVRLLELKELVGLQPARFEARPILGGMLLQSPDRAVAFEAKVVTKRPATAIELDTLRFAWDVCRGVKSNAIVLARAEGEGASSVGVAGGQTSRVDAVEIAIKKAGERTKGAVIASDAFFPFPDSIELLQRAGATAVIQPGGSVKDEEVVRAADAAGMAMIFTGVRHFRH